MAGLRLEAREFRDLARWRWVLTEEASGKFIADHEVRLTTADWQYEAFGELRGYLRWHTAPDTRAAEEARIVGEVGTWIGTQVLGPTVTAALLEHARRQPATVRVVVPSEAAELLYSPLELAYADGKPLSVQDVTLVMSVGPGPAMQPAAVGEQLRVLGLFSLPEGGRALNLRRERHALVRLVRGIAAAGRAADVEVLQYGVTRARLQDILEHHAGWDIVHISGHGQPGSLVLETEVGEPDPVTAADLAGLLYLARARVKLVTISACWSAATTAGQRRALGLLAEDDEIPSGTGRPASPASSSSGTLAAEVAARLGCAVLAMRYAVDDELAITFSARVYDLLARHGEPLPRAVGMTMRELAAGAGEREALWAATPTLLGDLAAELRLAAPEHGRRAKDATEALKMAGFPDEPSRFVGRTGVLARASAALAAASGLPGVLLQGMPGGGKTACALELAYGHEHAFDRLVWYKAPDEGMAVEGALTDFALRLERYLPGFQMADSLVSADRLAAFLPRLTELMERRRVLVVIDNVESLLTPGGGWRDERWEQIVNTLCGHHGSGRVILTSRRVPALSELARLRVESVDALSPDEALLLMRELPHLHALSQGVAAGMQSHVARRLALRAQEVAWGHPKLLELADGQAANPARLAALVNVGDQAWRRQGGVPEGFFAFGTDSYASSGSGEDYVQVLAAWTGQVSETLAPAERDLFWLLCCLEERDRAMDTVDAVWDGLRERLERDSLPPVSDEALAAITATGLAARQPGSGDAEDAYRVHPGVAAAGREQAGQAFRDAVDAEAAMYWYAVYKLASGEGSGEAGSGEMHTELALEAGLAAVPYLVRQRQWDIAGAILERVFLQDPSVANALTAMPAIQQITHHDPSQAGVLARVLAVIDPASADARGRTELAAAVAAGDYRAAVSCASFLADLCRENGRMAEALGYVEQTADYARQAALGPWTQLAVEGRRLQMLDEMGRAEQALAEVGRLRDQMRDLPATRGPDEATPPWMVREGLLNTGQSAAVALGRWEVALGLNAEILASMRGRSAPVVSVTRVRFNDHGPLLSLGRIAEALALLQACREAFEDAREVEALGAVFTALAEVEEARGHGDAAASLERDALHYKYLADDATSIAVSYQNLGGYLYEHSGDPASALASFLAAALVRSLVGIEGTGANTPASSVRGAAALLRVLSPDADPPSDVADLCGRLVDISGSDLFQLITRLSPDASKAERVLHDLTSQAQALAGSGLPIDDRSAS
jgi:tetratricopeptide (TPR) repeat protein